MRENDVQQKDAPWVGEVHRVSDLPFSSRARIQAGHVHRHRRRLQASTDRKPLRGPQPQRADSRSFEEPRHGCDRGPGSSRCLLCQLHIRTLAIVIVEAHIERRRVPPEMRKKPMLIKGNMFILKNVSFFRPFVVYVLYFLSRIL